jgi:hypothetical protein
MAKLHLKYSKLYWFEKDFQQEKYWAFEKKENSTGKNCVFIAHEIKTLLNFNP